MKRNFGNNNNNNTTSAGGAGAGSKLQQLQQQRKEQIPLIARFVYAFKSKCITLQKQRAHGVLLIQQEFREYLKRAGPNIHVMRQRRKESRRHFLVGVDRIIKAAVESGRIICIEELRERKEMYLDFVLSKMADLMGSEKMKRALIIEDEQEEREKLLDQLMANVPRDVVPGTFEYDEFQERCHIIRLETFQRTHLIKSSIAPKAGFIHHFQNDFRNKIKMDELEERIDLIRMSRASIAEIQMYEIERMEEQLRPVIEEERDIAVCGMTQSRALTGLYLLLGPGEGSEHDTRIELYLEEEAEARYLFQRMWEERTLLAAQFLFAEEQALRNSRRGIPAIEAHERCQIVTKLYQMKLLLLQGEFSVNDGMYVSSEAGSRRAIRWAEGRARDEIYQKAAATLHVALVPIEESRKRDTIRRSEAEQAMLMIQKVPAYYQQVLEPGARRGIFREWMSWARSVTFAQFSITLQAIEESRRSFIRHASVVDLEYLAGAEYLEFLEKKHRRLITKEMSSRAMVADAVWRNNNNNSNQVQQQQHRKQQRSSTSSPSSSPPVSPQNKNNDYHHHQSPNANIINEHADSSGRFSYNPSNSVNRNKTNYDYYYNNNNDSPSSPSHHHHSAANHHHYDPSAAFEAAAAVTREEEEEKIPPFFVKAVAEMSPPRK